MSKTRIFVLIVIPVICFLPALFLDHTDYAFTDENITRAIIGEAASEPYEGQLAIAHAILNRGTLKGVYGLKHWKSRSSPEAWQRASRALEEAKTGQDPTNNATSWENETAFGRPRWAYKMERTVKVGRHQFYREHHDKQ